MKREGRQHGMVRSYRILPAPLNPRPNSRFVNRFESPPAAGLFVKVPSRPTNHSKFTGKCTRPRCTDCHLHPACKSKDKTKGNNKNKSFNVVSSHQFISWRVVDGQPGLNYSGFSATGLADHLAHAYKDYDDEECEPGNDYERDDYKDGDHFSSPTADGLKHKDHDGSNNDGREDDDDKLSFCEVGFEWNQVEDGWCMIGEIDNP
ncbi:uncharacterized protein LOC115741338 [Rhodamnia argentea]|uniref:Uncharacterized protein LOC115741338 n=1 Tax=Rhodamnia argentea TaxID=178133 RepID=A0A8B8P8I3_9MYRT|nr:uncharacterized protein LOC115741338 [Rhodamnia argentea]